MEQWSGSTHDPGGGTRGEEQEASFARGSPTDGVAAVGLAEGMGGREKRIKHEGHQGTRGKNGLRRIDSRTRLSITATWQARLGLTVPDVIIERLFS